MNAESESRQIQEISQHLFRASNATGHFVQDETQLGAGLAGYLTPDLTLLPRTPRIGFIHRKLADGDLYFIANTSNQFHHVKATFRSTANRAEWLDPLTGSTSTVDNPSVIFLDLQPYESKLIVFTNSDIHPNTTKPLRHGPSRIIDLSKDWKVIFTGANQSVVMPWLHSWSDLPAFKYYSGTVTYEKTIDLSAADLSSGITPFLSFGQGMPIQEPNPLPEHSMKAYLDGPIREAAEVFVNDQRAGVVWHPPYKIDVSKFLTVGKNHLRIIVGNTAINSLAGQTLPTYRLLNERYGERFTPQDMKNLQPLPSGLVGGLQLDLEK